MKRSRSTQTLTPPLAIGWQIWVRNRLGASAAAALLVATIAAAPLAWAFLAPEHAVLASVICLFLVFGVFLNAILFVEELGNPASGYPPRMYSLPVPTSTLVLWPLVYSAAVPALLWVAVAYLIYRPSGYDVPVLLPALGLAAAMAWLQVLSWAPLRPTWLRLIGAVAVVGVLAGIMWGMVLMKTVDHRWIALLSAAALAAAYPPALAGVTRDRRGEFWRLWPERFRLSFGAVGGERRPFRSAAEAQRWYEWRCNGLALPAAVLGMVVLIFVVGSVATGAAHKPETNVAPFVIMTLFLPVFLATSTGPAVSRLNPPWVKHPRVITFLGTRPVTTRALVLAKYRMTAESAVLTWGLVVAAVALWIALEGGTTTAAELWRGWTRYFPGWRSGAVLALAAAIAPALTFRQGTDYFALGLSGRAWIENLASVPMVLLLGGGMSVGLWLQIHPEDWPRFQAVLPWVLGIAVAVKASLAACSFRAAMVRRLTLRRDLVGTAIGWTVVVALGLALAQLTLPATTTVAMRLAVAAGILIAVPFARLPLTTLALDWNRHR